MCTTDIYVYLYADGHRETVRRPSLCTSSRHGRPCANNVLFQHSPQSVPHSYPATSTPASAYIYPSPSSSPSSSSSYYGHGRGRLHSSSPSRSIHISRTSTPASTRSGDDSDRRSSRRRRSSLYYVNGHDEYGGGRERVLLVDNPPTPRTPPQSFMFPRTAPSSPSFGSTATLTGRRASPAQRPVIVDERCSRRNGDVSRDRTRIHVEFVNDDDDDDDDDGHVGKERRSRHARQSSTSSYGSRHGGDMHTTSLPQPDQQARGEQVRLAQQHEEMRRLKRREGKIADEIARANAEIARRHAVPVPPAPPLRTCATSTAVAAAAAAAEREQELIDRMHKLDMQAKRHDDDDDDDEAQRHRLMQRMQPRRRATVGPGSRRHRVLYDDGLYRWE